MENGNWKLETLRKVRSPKSKEKQLSDRTSSIAICDFSSSSSHVRTIRVGVGIAVGRRTETRSIFYHNHPEDRYVMSATRKVEK